RAHVERGESHLAIPARAAPRRHRGSHTQSLLRQDRNIPLWRFERLLGACICLRLGVIADAGFFPLRWYPMEHPGFFERAGPFSLRAMVEAAGGNSREYHLHIKIK